MLPSDMNLLPGDVNWVLRDMNLVSGDLNLLSGYMNLLRDSKPTAEVKHKFRIQILEPERKQFDND